MLDLEKLEVVLKSYRTKGYDVEVRFTPDHIEFSLRKQCRVRGKWYGLTRHATWEQIEHASFDIIEVTMETMEIELVREAQLEGVLPKYEPVEYLRGSDVFKGWDDRPRPYHQGRYEPGLKGK